jgi:hypothetical protein
MVVVGYLADTRNETGLSGLGGIPQCESQHVEELDPILEDRLWVVVDEEVMINAGDSKTLALVKGELISKGAGTHLYLPCAGFAVEIDDPFQERCANA